ncbi:MAG: alpha/beta hydrolase, partial [Moorea sp. SIO3C2]|nr:alpha/beta hydrolase [Moorena sp. SIO3C2]
MSNREVREGETGIKLFGEGPNQKGLDEVRIATAVKDEAQPRKERWTLNLLAESPTLSPEALPSLELFKEVLQKTQAGEIGSEWVFYIHGFNQSFKKTLEASLDLTQTYGVNVIVFSWVANPGGLVPGEYIRARQAAKASSNAVDR